MGSEGAAPAFAPEQLGMEMHNNGAVSGHLRVDTNQSKDVPALTLCATSDHITQIAVDQQDTYVGKKTVQLVSKCMLPSDPRCVLAHADLRKGLIKDTILRVHGVGDVPVRSEWAPPNSPVNIDLQSARAEGNNVP